MLEEQGPCQGPGEALDLGVLKWTDNQTPVSPTFDDIYYAKEDGFAESRFVFIGFNRLEERFPEADRFHIAELGFGTGLNFFAAVDLWLRKRSPSDSKNAWLSFTSFEKHPLKPAEIRKAVKPWPEIHTIVERFLEEYEELPYGQHRFIFPDWKVTLDLFIGDANHHLKDLEGPVDAWFLDGFAPQKNPELWNLSLFEELARASAAHSTFATYASAGFVRRNLQQVGFAVTRTRGFGRKREMLFGERRSARPISPLKNHRQIVGGGISGLSTAQRFFEHDLSGEIHERASQWIPEASGNPQALVMPNLTTHLSASGEFSLSSFLFCCRQLRRLEAKHHDDIGWHRSGLLQLLNSPEKEERYLQALAAFQIPRSMARLMSREEASELAGIRIFYSALYWPSAGFLDTQKFALTLHKNFKDKIEVNFSSSKLIGADQILCISKNLPKEFSDKKIPWKIQRGQISYWSPLPKHQHLRMPVIYGGYILPPSRNRMLAGSTYSESSDHDEVLQMNDHEKILSQAQAALRFTEQPSVIDGRSATRVGLRDALPLVGELGPNFVNFGYGSKAYSQAFLGAEVLVSEIKGLPAPVGRTLRRAIAPQRFEA